jgi:hypothetical protein
VDGGRAEAVTEGAALSQATREPGEDWDQGDVVEEVYFAALDAARPGVLVTPACDIEQDKLDFWTFVALYRDDEVARSLVAKDLEGWKRSAGGATLTKNQRESLAKKVRELIDQRFPRYHWLPVALGGHPAHVADFSCVCSLPADEVRANAKRARALVSSWREQLPARYASYMARVGTIDFKRDEIDPQVDRLVRSLADE